MSAVLSDCGRYRYALWREVAAVDLLGESSGTVLFVMLNPSTADASEDDPTIRRCIGFARRWGYSRLAVGNLFALRSTNPTALFDADDPIGPDNDFHLGQLAGEADRTIAAWGSFPSNGRVATVLSCIDVPVYALGLTKNGSPRHPLYVKGDTEPMPFAEVARG